MTNEEKVKYLLALAARVSIDPNHETNYSTSGNYQKRILENYALLEGILNQKLANSPDGGKHS